MSGSSALSETWITLDENTFWVNCSFSKFQQEVLFTLFSHDNADCQYLLYFTYIREICSPLCLLGSNSAPPAAAASGCSAAQAPLLVSCQGVCMGQPKVIPLHVTLSQL